MTTLLYGIPNCATVKKARDWLTAHGVDYTFHDFRKDGIDAKLIDAWLKQLSPQQLLNRQGLTWRRLDPNEQAKAVTACGIRDLLLAHPTMIKRPVLAIDGQLLCGFDAECYATACGA